MDLDLEPVKNLDPNLVNLDGVDEVDALNTLAWELAYNKEDMRSLELAERALLLSQSRDGSGLINRKGAALALRTLAHIDIMRAEYSTALPRLFAALDLLETLDETEALLFVMANLGWSYFNLGDFARAVEILQKGLKLSWEKKCLDAEVNILSSLGGIYGECGDNELSFEMLQRALDYKKDTGINLLHGLALNNLAMQYLSVHQYDQAMGCATRALDMARQLGLKGAEATYLDTVGQIALARKEYALAENVIKESIVLNQNSGVNDDEIWLSLGRVYFEQNRMDEAADLLNDTLDSVEKKGTHRFAYLFHELLSKIYEARCDLSHALEHYKLYHESMSRVFNENTQGSIDNLAILHKVETSRIDSEIYRLRNQALGREISARRLDVAHLEVLATTDALTGLFNRRHFLTLGGYSLQEARKSGDPLTVLWMDIDNFKQVNDRYGHQVGDRVLQEVSSVIQASLRSHDLLSRFGGEEFVALLPNTHLSGAQHIAERILGNTALHTTQAEDHTIQVTLSMGTARALPSMEDLETLLNRADQAQYAAKRAGKNRLVVDWTCEPA